MLGWLVLLYLENMKWSSNDSNGARIFHVSHEEEIRGMLQRQENKRRKQTKPASRPRIPCDVATGEMKISTAEAQLILEYRPFSMFNIYSW